MARRTAKPLNDDILMGWTNDAEKQFGFTTSSRSGDSLKPVLYSGPHLTTIAPSGAGKGVSSAITTLLEYPGQIIALDVKGELYDCTHRARRSMGQKVVRLDPFHLLSGDSDALNPLDVVNMPHSDLETDCETLAKLLSAGKEFSKDPFWHLTANALNSALLMYVATCETEENRNIVKMAELLHGDDNIYQTAVLLDTKGKVMPKAAYRELAAFLQLPERDTRPSTMATAQSFLKSLMSQRVSDSIVKTSFDLDAFRRGDPISIYIVIPPDRLTSHAALIALWVGTLLKVIFSRTTAPVMRTLALLDEASSLGNFPMLETAVSLGRSYGLRVWTFWQDLQQIQASFPNSWRTIVNNSGIQVFGINSKLMATELSALLQVPPNKLMSMDDRTQVVQLPRQECTICTRLNYLRDKRYEGKFDHNRYYPQLVSGKKNR